MPITEMPKSREELIEELRSAMEFAHVDPQKIDHFLMPENLERVSDNDLITAIDEFAIIGQKAAKADENVSDFNERVNKLAEETIQRLNVSFDDIGEKLIKNAIEKKKKNKK